MHSSINNINMIKSSPTPLRIAIIAHSLYPITEPYAGGLEKMTHLICDELVDKGHEVLLYAHKDSQTKATLVPLMTDEEFDNIIGDQGPKNLSMGREELFSYLAYQMAFRDIIERDERGEIDIVHNHSLHHIPMMTGQVFGPRFFTTFHTPMFPALHLALVTLKLGTSTQFTSVSKYQQQLFSEYVPSHVVYNGIDVDQFKANLEPISDEVYFWYGRICPEKGTHLAIQYCQQANKKLIIAGPKSNQCYFDDYVKPLLDQDANLKDTDRLLNYVGHLTKSEVNQYLPQVTAMLFTSTWDEPYGLTLAESLACGTPVLGFDAGASSEIITPETGVIVPKEDSEAFIRGFEIIKLISRKACRDRAVEFCSSTPMVEGYLDLYYRTLQQIQYPPFEISNLRSEQSNEQSSSFKTSSFRLRSSQLNVTQFDVSNAKQSKSVHSKSTAWQNMIDSPNNNSIKSDHVLEAANLTDMTLSKE
ncbi:glycosyltransferase [Psychrobacter sp.]|uniref:glycosyltransferase n=1 Tax=Psychrobacter sp. TaxID=56811 RepID=UPI0025CB8CDB|nr:glycosyltransferase [Psychrobacter sp.]